MDLLVMVVFGRRLGSEWRRVCRLVGVQMNCTLFPTFVSF